MDDDGVEVEPGRQAAELGGEPLGCGAAVGAFLMVAGIDPQQPGLAVGLEVDAGDQRPSIRKGST